MNMRSQKCKVILIGDYSLEAVDSYINLIEVGIAEALMIPVSRIYRLEDIEKGDIIVTIDAMSFTKVWLFGLRNRLHLSIFNWFQGIVPEEAMMVFNSRRRKIIWEIFEWITLKNAAFCFFVSFEMLQHYRKKYKLSLLKNFSIIPCYNKALLPDFITPSNKYSEPNFVYAGSLSKWQCIDETLKLYKLIEEAVPASTITVLTREFERAELLLKKYGVKNYCVKFVHLADLDAELMKYKYGFIIRNDNIVNRVATPTKMNSYLAMGIIPIYTDVISAFEENITLGRYSLKLHLGDAISLWAKKIIYFEKNYVVDSQDYYSIVKDVFNCFYSDSYYVSQMKLSLT